MLRTIDDVLQSPAPSVHSNATEHHTHPNQLNHSGDEHSVSKSDFASKGTGGRSGDDVAEKSANEQDGYFGICDVEVLFDIRKQRSSGASTGCTGRT